MFLRAMPMASRALFEGNGAALAGVEFVGGEFRKNRICIADVGNGELQIAGPPFAKNFPASACDFSVQ